jgi:7,8-dihydropterin-6-yl-methyl-4-(beta-D-ribofuranosyl)aminobenzene 5'-phosphate synthase
MTISSGDLVRRNAAFAATGAFAGLAFPTSDTLQVLGCVDSRVDPGDVDPIALEPVDDVVVTTLVDNVYDALLSSSGTITRAPFAAGTAQAPSSSRGVPTSG